MNTSINFIGLRVRITSAAMMNQPPVDATGCVVGQADNTLDVVDDEGRLHRAGIFHTVTFLDPELVAGRARY